MTRHFSKGGSAAERFINCPGSVVPLATPNTAPSDEADYTKEGTAAHEALALLNNNPDMEAWEIAGRTFGDGIVADPKFVKSVDMAATVCRSLGTMGTRYVEHFFHNPVVHEDFGGTVDFAVVADSLMNLVEFKNGVLDVEVEENAQLMYYAYGLLLKHPGVRRVVFRVVQPNGFNPDGPTRRWETTSQHIMEWATSTLIPAMERISAELVAGEWCRFCPRKLGCPLMRSLFEAAATHDPKSVVTLDDRTLGQSAALAPAVRSYLKALDEEVWRRLDAGKRVALHKLVRAKTNRVWKPGSESIFKARYGAAAFEPAELKSPRQMEEAGPGAKDLVKQWAYTPEGGLTVALESDKRAEIRQKTLAETFAGAISK